MKADFFDLESFSIYHTMSELNWLLLYGHH